MGHPQLSVLFAYGASDRGGVDHQRGLKELLRAEGLQPTVDTSNWGATARDPRQYDIDWIARKRFPAPDSDARRLWEMTFGVGLSAASERQPLYQRLALAVFRRSIRDAYVHGYESVSAGMVPVTNDVLGYLRNPGPTFEGVANDIESFIARRPAPRVVVGLSLGGIILVDTLSKLILDGKRPEVDLLVTVGSQAPYLFACNALGSLHTDMKPLPLFLPWLNVWTPNDFLSFPAKPVFAPYLQDNDDHPEMRSFIRDHQAWNPNLFPAVHSQYFTETMSTAVGIRRMLVDMGAIERPEPWGKEQN